MMTIAEAATALHDQLWRKDIQRMGQPRRFVLITLRLLYVTVRELLTGNLTLHAMSLVYITLLSLVPLLAVSFSILKAFGVHNQMEPMLMRLLEPLGEQAPEITQQVVGFVANVKVGVLGTVGLAILIYTVISMLQKIETAFNSAWHVRTLRSISHRFSLYLTVILVGPVLVFTAIGITASVTNHEWVRYLLTVEPLGTLYVQVSKLLPYLLVWAAFSFIYLFVPNTTVHFRPALIAGLIAALIWQTAGWGFAQFIASSSKYAAIYSGFAIVIIVLIWLYINWLILLVGAKIAFFIQNPRYMTLEHVPVALSNRMQERLGLMVMYLIGKQHLDGGEPWSIEKLSNVLQMPAELVERQVTQLQDNGFLTATASEPPAYLPAHSIESLRLSDLLAGIRRAGEGASLNPDRYATMQAADSVISELEQCAITTLGERTLRDMIIEHQPVQTLSPTSQNKPPDEILDP